MANIAISGGIGSGKSRLGAVLRKRGELVIDADVLAKDCLDSDSFKQALTLRFPELTNLAAAQLRSKLASIVFTDPQELSWLESFIHPCVRAKVGKFAQEHTGENIFVEVPVLAATKDYDQLVVVTAPIDLRIKRLRERGLDDFDIFNRMNNQPHEDVFKSSTNFLIDGSLEDSEFDQAVTRLLIDLSAATT
jgi:dephospho-CoA kinase